MNQLLSQAITAFLAENIAVIMLVLIIVLPWVAWKAAWKVGGWKNKFEQDLHIWKNTFEQELRLLSKKIDGLQAFLSSKFGEPLVESLSPLALNERGKQIAQTIDAASLADRYAAQIQPRASGMNAWQIQELCFDFARDHVLKDLEKQDAAGFDRVTTCAYQEGIDPLEIMRIIGILMRDILLQYAGQSHQAVDDHAPATSAV